ncbi:hypothetical protein EB796_007592 [Bugula neritina]|uniref:Uncharacterized protein n=1 Tax=Bugula neritina TaxID=10212 RepID=A0A7J7K651_BUGNE|nr:hypothetical protein EB796_007592 [Bugula neritina]
MGVAMSPPVWEEYLVRSLSVPTVTHVSGKVPSHMYAMGTSSRMLEAAYATGTVAMVSSGLLNLILRRGTDIPQNSLGCLQHHPHLSPGIEDDSIPNCGDDSTIWIQQRGCPDPGIHVEGGSETALVGRKEPSPSSHPRCSRESPTHSKTFYNVKTI